MHRTLNLYRTGLLVPAKAIATVPVWTESLGFWWNCAPPSKEISSKEISRSAFWNFRLVFDHPQYMQPWIDELAASIPNSLKWCFTLHHHWCPEHRRLWHIPRAGEEQNRDRDWATAWNIYQSPKHFSELFRCLPKIPVLCFQKKEVMIFSLPSLLNFVFFECRDAERGIMTNSPSNLQLPYCPSTTTPASSGLTIQNPTFLQIQPPIIFSFWSSMIVTQTTIFHSWVFHVPLLHINKHIWEIWEQPATAFK